jgi:indoleamine 2,3-dioxygenase
MLPPLPRLENYGLSAEMGFLPDEQPLERLESFYYEPWERIMDEFHVLFFAKQLRVVISGVCHTTIAKPNFSYQYYRLNS